VEAADFQVEVRPAPVRVAFTCYSM